MTENGDTSDFLRDVFAMSEEKIKETRKNKSLTTALERIATECKLQIGDMKFISITAPPLLYNLASTMRSDDQNKHYPFLVDYILQNKIQNEPQLKSAFQFIKSNPGSFAIELFDEACGIGVIVTREQISEIVTEIIGTCKEELLEKRYLFNTGKLVGQVRSKSKWADGKLIREEIESQIANLIGPKTAEDDVPTNSSTKQSSSKVTQKKIDSTNKPVSKVKFNTNPSTSSSSTNSSLINTEYTLAGEALQFHKPGENYNTDGYVITPYTMKLLQTHLSETGGQVITRFPPEPNGILHIGHAKSINFNFGYARFHNGITYLRYDDTNPEKEEERFFREIKEMVEWLGYKPIKVTHASDNFQQLYDWAIELIKSGNAYVCHQKVTEIRGINTDASPWRDRPLEESLKLFDDMKNGLIDEGKATLRMKLTMLDGKEDPVAYRIKFTPHPRTGDKWCVYPTYDYTHCLCDSIENITHSLCTKEFQSRRITYYWLCNALNVYCPVQWEFARLNLLYTVVSKRKILQLIDKGIVKDWDDPRLYTLTALRRRGVPPEAINRFCAKVGVTMSQTVLDPSLLDSCIQDVLNSTAKRAMAVCEAVKIIITNFPYKDTILLDVPDFPSISATDNLHQIPFSKEIMIDGNDISETVKPGYRRLAPDQPVGLRHTGLVISLDKIIKDNSSGAITEVHVTCVPIAETSKPKCWIQWVAEPISCQVRLYERLFKHPTPEDPSVVPGGFLTDCNLNSLQIKTYFVDRSVAKAKHLDRFQFERIGYFTVDFDSCEGNLIFNRTLALREDSGKDEIS